ncbi:GNAT superfamily N-acetyltransferase [Streptomyces canus]
MPLARGFSAFRVDHMNYVIRSVRADEWPAVKELRLAALQDPVAPLAFLETYEEAVVRPDSFWEERTARGAEGADEVQTIIAEAPDGRWVGTVTVLLEEPGTTDWAGFAVERKQGHLVGVFVRPEERGSGLTDVLFDAAVEWAWAHGAERGAADRARGQRAGTAVLSQGGLRAERGASAVAAGPGGVRTGIRAGTRLSRPGIMGHATG